MCASGAGDAPQQYEAFWELMLAASPAAYDARVPRGTAGIVPVSPPKQQGECQSCSAFAVAAAAEGALASGAGVNASTLDLSEQQLYSCSGGSVVQTLCSSGGSFDAPFKALEQQRELLQDRCLPYREEVGDDMAVDVCRPRCNDTVKLAKQGTFLAYPITSAALAQRHIREWGGVITRFDVSDDLRPFFANPSNRLKVYNVSAGARIVARHAVVLIGYDNEREFWLIKNSWGPSWADGGFFRVAYGQAGVLNDGDAFGITWTSPSVFAPPLAMERAPLPANTSADTARTCFSYTAKPGDYLSGIAFDAGIQLPTLLRDNLGALPDVHAPLAGKRLRVCDVPLQRQPPAAAAEPGLAPPQAPAFTKADSSTRSSDILIAASPSAYSSLNLSQTGGVQLVSTPGDQGACAMCVPFVMAALAETTVANVMQVSVALTNVSEMWLATCTEPRLTCSSGSSLNEGLKRVVDGAAKLASRSCMPYQLSVLSSGDDTHCSHCTEPNPVVSKGKFKAVRLGSIASIQQHIRNYGAVVARFDIFDDVRTFFAKNPKGVYRRPAAGAKFSFSHAVVLVGYDNEQGFWQAKNSWGTGFADGGFFKVAFGACGIADAYSTYGFTWEPSNRALMRTLPVSPSNIKRNGTACFNYLARESDYLSKIAWLAGLDLAQFLQDNAKAVVDLDAPLAGKQLLVCGAARHRIKVKDH